MSMDTDLQANLAHEAVFLVCDKGKCLNVLEQTKVCIMVLQGETDVYYQGTIKKRKDTYIKAPLQSSIKDLSDIKESEKFHKSSSEEDMSVQIPISKYPYFLPDTKIPIVCNNPRKSLLAITISTLLNSQLSDIPLSKRDLADWFVPYSCPMLLKRLAKSTRVVRVKQWQYFDGRLADLVFARCFRPTAAIVVSSEKITEMLYRDSTRKDRQFRDTISRFGVFENLAQYSNLERYRSMFVETNFEYKETIYKKGSKCTSFYILIRGEINLHQTGLQDGIPIEKPSTSLKIEDPGTLATKTAYKKVSQNPAHDPPFLHLTLTPYSLLGAEFLPTMTETASKFNPWESPELTQGVLLDSLTLNHSHSAISTTFSKAFKISTENIFSILVIFGKHSGKLDCDSRLYQWRKRLEIDEKAKEIVSLSGKEKVRMRSTGVKETEVRKKTMDAATLAAVKALDSAIKARKLDFPRNRLECAKLVPSNHIVKNLCNSTKYSLV